MHKEIYLMLRASTAILKEKPHYTKQDKKALNILKEFWY